MPAYGGGPPSDQSLKPSKKPKSREVSSRFLSSSSTPVADNGNQSPNPSQILIRQKSSSDSSRKHKNFEKSGFSRGLWPSASSSKPERDGTLADCIRRERIRDDNVDERKHKSKQAQYPLFLGRQRSCTEFGRFDENEKKTLYCNEIQKPVFGGVLGGSMRYTGKLKHYPGKSSNSSDEIGPGRFSVDENSLRKKPSVFSDSDTQDSEWEYYDSAGKNSTASYMAPTVSSRKHGIEVASRFLNDRRWSNDTNADQKSVGAESNGSPRIFSLKKGNGNWGSSSPARAGSPKGKLKSKPPTSPSRGKGGGGGVGNILSLGIELLKGKKAWSSNAAASPLGAAESVHELRIFQNRLMQWRYGNARAETVNGTVINLAQTKMLHGRNALIKLRHSVIQKKLQLQREKLEWKLNYIIFSQIKGLEAWGNLERQHLSAVSTTKDCLHSVVCRIPLVDGAKVEPQTTSVAVRHASDVAASISLMLTTFSSQTEKTVRVLSELATVVKQEKMLLEECLDLYTDICILEIRERSLKTSIMQLNLLQQQRTTTTDISSHNFTQYSYYKAPTL